MSTAIGASWNDPGHEDRTQRNPIPKYRRKIAPFDTARRENFISTYVGEGTPTNGAAFHARRHALGMKLTDLSLVMSRSKRTLNRWEIDPWREVSASNARIVDALVVLTRFQIDALMSYDWTDHEPLKIHREGWRDLTEFGFCLPESWWVSVVGMVPGIPLEWEDE